MPGRLKPDARCPHCSDPLMGICDITHGWENGIPPVIRVTRAYYHDKPAFGRRKRPCRNEFTNYGAAERERRALEV